MFTIIWVIALILIALCAVSTNKVFHHLPILELKRQARSGQSIAKALYRAANFGQSLQAFLLVIALFATGGSIALFFSNMPLWLALILSAFDIGLIFLWVPYSRLTSIETRLAVLLTPFISICMHYVQGPFDRLGRILHGYYDDDAIAGIYEVDDLLKVLDKQKTHPGNRIPVEDIDRARRALRFGSKTVGDIYVPRKAVIGVKPTDSVGPKLMDQLHKSGHTIFPVIEGKSEKVVGIIRLEDIVNIKHSISISEIMNTDIHYVYDDALINNILDDFFESRGLIFVVENKFNEFVGIVTLQDVLRLITGRSSKQKSSDTKSDIITIVDEETGTEQVQPPAD